MRDLLNRMVLVRADTNTFRGPQPLMRDGMWEGVVEGVDPIKKNDVVVDHALKIKIACGTSKHDVVLTVMASSDRWRLRFPKKGE